MNREYIEEIERLARCAVDAVIESSSEEARDALHKLWAYVDEVKRRSDK